jgi:hypothetical protein
MEHLLQQESLYSTQYLYWYKIDAFFELILAHDTKPMEEFPEPQGLSSLLARAKSILSTSSYAEKLEQSGLI